MSVANSSEHGYLTWKCHARNVVEMDTRFRSTVRSRFGTLTLTHFNADYSNFKTAYFNHGLYRMILNLAGLQHQIRFDTQNAVT